MNHQQHNLARTLRQDARNRADADADGAPPAEEASSASTAPELDPRLPN